jgi:tetratricopeptide (TPR) repeat protein/predicted Ser/Thr protein kinase
MRKRDGSGPDEHPAPRHSGGRDRQARIQAILTDVAHRLGSGLAVNCESLERKYSDLLPDLSGGLRFLLRHRRGPSSTNAEAHDEAHEPPTDSELAVLRDGLGSYEDFERVRYGGQGVVYRARQRGTGRTVAIKVLLDGPLATAQQRARFAREIQLVSRLHHANIVSVYECGVLQGRNFYVMEFVEGDAIDDYAALQDLTPHEIVLLVSKVCGAIQHAHQNGVLHRDLNPANILVTSAGEPRVYDFGLAKDLWGSAASTTGIGCGTFPYLSPEQAGADDGRADVRSDVYAVGLILYELLADSFPYPVQGDPALVRRAIVAEEPLPIRRALAQCNPNWARDRDQVDRDLEMILAKALAKRKADRYQSIAELRVDLEHWLTGDAVAARAGHRLYVLRKTVRRHRFAFALAAVALAAFGSASLGITYFWVQARTERDNARGAAREAYDLFEFALNKMENSVRSLPGGVAVRNELIADLADRLPQLQSSVRSDPALDALALGLTERQGDIALEQGHRAQAASCYRAFLDQSLRQATAGVVAARSAVLRGYLKLGQSLDDPVPVWDEGLQFAEKYAAEAAGDDRCSYEAGRLNCKSGYRMQTTGDALGALRRYECALAFCEAADHVDSRWMRLRAESLTGAARVLQQLGRASDSESAMRDAVRLREEDLTRFPSDVQCRSDLIASYAHLGTIHRDRGQLAEAKLFMRKAAEQSDLLALMDPASTVRDSDRYSDHHRLAALCLDAGDIDEARAESEKAAAIARSWFAREQSPGSRSTLCYAHLLRGKVKRTEQAWAAARTCYLEALGLAEELVSCEELNPGRRVMLVDICDALGLCEEQLGNLEVAVAYMTRAYDLQCELACRAPVDAQQALREVQCTLNLASIRAQLADTGNLETASELTRAAQARLADLDADGLLEGYQRKRAYLLETIERQHAALHDSPINGQRVTADLQTDDSCRQTGSR